MQTDLDKSLTRARKNPKAGGAYVNQFLNSDIFVPIWDDPEEAANDDKDNKEELRPVITSNDDGEFVMCFDTRGRLESWMDVAAGVVSLKGFDFLAMIKGQPVQVCLNAGTQYMQIFSQDEIKWLLNNTKIN